MSTTKIREVLEHFSREATYPESPRARLAAEGLTEVEAIERDASVTRDAALEEAALVAARHSAYEACDDIRALKSRPARNLRDEVLEEAIQACAARGQHAMAAVLRHMMFSPAESQSQESPGDICRCGRRRDEHETTANLGVRAWGGGRPDCLGFMVLQSQPAHRYLDAETVREVLTRALYHLRRVDAEGYGTRAMQRALDELGLDLDAAPATPLPLTACGKRGLGGVCRRWDDHPGVCEFEPEGVACAAPKPSPNPKGKS